jgi:hypothetical protein
MQRTTNNSSPQKRRQWWTWFAFASVLICLTTAVVIHVLSRETPINRLKRQIRIDVPIGLTREQVESWAQRSLGQTPSIQTPLPPGHPGHTISETAGIPASEQQVLVIVIPSVGRYTTPLGEIAQNQLWVFFTLDEAGQVTGQYFLTLEELAAIEQKRLRPERAGH